MVELDLTGRVFTDIKRSWINKIIWFPPITIIRVLLTIHWTGRTSCVVSDCFSSVTGAVR